MKKQTPALFVLVLFVVVTGLISVHRTKKGSNDFDTFYKAGQAVRIAGGDGIYYAGEYYRDEGNVSPFLYPPFAACLFAPITFLPVAPAAFLWNFLNVILFLASLCLILSFFRLGTKDVDEIWEPMTFWDRIVFCGMPLLILLDNLTMAQVNILVFFFSVAGLWLWQRGRGYGAGILLSAATMIKVTPALFILYFLIKKQWKVMGGMGLGFLLFILMIPSALFGIQKNRILHRQFLGRTVKPLIIETLETIKKEAPHPLKRSAFLIKHNRLSNQLVKQNQSLEATLTRLLLKDRKTYGYDSDPIFVVRNYEKLPVLFGGLAPPVLSWLIRGLQALMFSILIWIWCKSPEKNPGPRSGLECALLLITTTLWAPSARSHQFVAWLYTYGALLAVHWQSFEKSTSIENSHRKSFLPDWAKWASLIYLLQGIPYGKAAGMGTWAGLILWLGMVSILIGKDSRETEELCRI